MAHLHRAHAERPDRDSGVRRHRQPYSKFTRCLRREKPLLLGQWAEARLHKQLRRDAKVQYIEG